MTKREVKKELTEFVENELGISFGDDILLSERYQETPRGDEIFESFKTACEEIYNVTVDDERFELAETIQEVLDECADSVIEEEDD